MGKIGYDPAEQEKAIPLPDPVADPTELVGTPATEENLEKFSETESGGE